MSGEVAPPREPMLLFQEEWTWGEGSRPCRDEVGLREKPHRQRGRYGGGSQTGAELVLGRR